MSKKPDTDTENRLAPADAPARMEVEQRDGEKIGRTLARIALDPQTRNAHVASVFGTGLFANSRKPELLQCSEVLAEEIERAAKGDLALASRVFTSQAITLDTMFTDLARRAAENIGSHPLAMERYTRLALKAQANCRATLEALARVHQPREQTVRHVHVNEGAQAIIADQFHHHPGGQQNAKSTEQPHATGPGAAGIGPAMLGDDAQGNGVPIPGDQGRATVPDARRKGQRRT